MRTVYAITTGGSVLDIMGIFEEKQMAEEVVEEWRENMGVHDDGWGVQEFTVWYRKPAVTRFYTETAFLDVNGTEVDWQGNPIVQRETSSQPVYEWDENKPTPRLYERPRDDDGSYYVHAGADTPEAAHEAVEASLVRRGKALPDIRARLTPKPEVTHEETKDELVARLVGAASCPECAGPVVDVWQIDSNSATATVSCAQQHKWTTPAFNFQR